MCCVDVCRHQRVINNSRYKHVYMYIIIYAHNRAGQYFDYRENRD